MCIRDSPKDSHSLKPADLLSSRCGLRCSTCSCKGAYKHCEQARRSFDWLGLSLSRVPRAAR
eukprot:3817800-Alexandrium_andersonii.AAC.1